VRQSLQPRVIQHSGKLTEIRSGPLMMEVLKVILGKKCGVGWGGNSGANIGGDLALREDLAGQSVRHLSGEKHHRLSSNLGQFASCLLGGEASWRFCWRCGCKY
jgi:hypothetical protein